ncbi:radical SAM protein [Maridesulfovibrio sp.]|uniref:radical SAM protein n=1 Tax=Maridesulfovibrio sp. TaxID=2795000 RepID=UPI002A189FBB|nr:radical SAM protein [Maridesulfovibrio sp.]
MSNDEFRIDSHKLMFHPKRVSDWLSGKNIGPLFMEVSPTSACNHRCVFCGYDFTGHKPKYIQTDVYLSRLKGMAASGLKSILFSGEGESFMHKDFTRICNATKNAGIDTAIATNGVLMTPDKVEEIINNVSWIKVSCNGTTPGSYKDIQGTSADDFYKVIDNLKEAVRIRKELNSKCTLGLQSLLLPENRADMPDLVRICGEIGLDYMVVKPYSQHPLGLADDYKGLTYEQFAGLEKELKRYETDSFRVIYRARTMERLLQGDRGYKKCMALPFWSYVDVDMNVWGCPMFIGDDRFLYGNLVDESFEEIWNGKKRKDSLEWFKDFDVSGCRTNCRMDKVNTYLWELAHPNPHVNFI